MQLAEFDVLLNPELLHFLQEPVPQNPMDQMVALDSRRAERGAALQIPRLLAHWLLLYSSVKMKTMM